LEEAMREDEKRSRRLAKEFRHNLTRAETILWSRLRREAIARMRFRRQHPIGSYVADFACIPAMLVVEVDGGTHSTAEELEHDRRRDAYMRSLGWRIVRVQNDDIYRNSDRVLDMIYALATHPANAEI
jgi:very-short-patch-repair endonuclease